MSSSRNKTNKISPPSEMSQQSIEDPSCPDEVPFTDAEMTALNEKWKKQKEATKIKRLAQKKRAIENKEKTARDWKELGERLEKECTDRGIPPHSCMMYWDGCNCSGCDLSCWNHGIKPSGYCGKVPEDVKRK